MVQFFKSVSRKFDRKIHVIAYSMSEMSFQQISISIGDCQYLSKWFRGHSLIKSEDAVLD